MIVFHEIRIERRFEAVVMHTEEAGRELQAAYRNCDVVEVEGEKYRLMSIQPVERSGVIFWRVDGVGVAK